jgi:glutathione S-transferase
LILFESRAIARYVAEKAGSSLVPAAGDIRARALYDQAQNIEAFSFEPYAGGLAWELFGKAQLGIATNMSRVEEHKAKLAKKLMGYERILSKTRYLAGDEICLVDLFHLLRGNRLLLLGVNFLEDTDNFPNVARYDSCRHTHVYSDP